MSLYLMGPTHQQYGRVVVFMLFSGGAFTAFPDSTVILPINPEEFTLQRPERVSVVQTLGDPFVDEFGTVPGVLGQCVKRVDGVKRYTGPHDAKNAKND